jgi:hypothetical protein
MEDRGHAPCSIHVKRSATNGRHIRVDPIINCFGLCASQTPTKEGRSFLVRTKVNWGEIIANGTMRASAKLVELIDAESEHVAADISKHVLAIAGIKPAADSTTLVNINFRAGYVIDLSDDPPKAIDVTPNEK